MKRIIALITILLIAHCSLFIAHCFAQTPDWAWAKSAGGNNNDKGYSVSTDANGNIYITGNFYSPTISFGSYTLTNNGNVNIFLVKYDASGNVLWAKSAGGTSDDEGLSVTTDTIGNIYITGCFSSPTIKFGGYTLTNADNSGNTDDIFLTKYDSNGNVLWAKSVGGDFYDLGYSVTTDASGNVYITGVFDDGFILVKYDTNGKVIWTKSASYDDASPGSSVATDKNGNIYVTGCFGMGSITFGGVTLTNAGHRNVFLVKYDLTGNVLWAKSAGGSGWDYGFSVTTDASNNLYITGYFNSPTISFGNYTLTNADNSGNTDDIFLAKYDANGKVLWAQSAGGSGQDNGNSVTTDASDNVYLTGYFYSPTISFGSNTLTNADNSGNTDDIFLAKYDSNGKVLWTISAGGSRLDEGISIIADVNSNVYLTGGFESPTISFGSSTLTNAWPSYSDVFLAKLDNKVGINELTKDNGEWTIYPNPANQLSVISYQLSEKSNVTIKIYNLLGNELETVINQEQGKGEHRVNLDAGNLSNGIYLLSVQSENLRETRKLIIQK